jgi:hypothetical protein
MITMATVSWFSAGCSSAVATKLMIDEIDRIIYTHIEDQHSDTLRFVQDCEKWFKKPIEIISGPLRTVENACLSAGGKGYLNGPAGAACSLRLKRKVRLKWEKKHDKEPLKYIWGLDHKERHRCLRLEKTMPLQEHCFPLVEREIDKTTVHKIMTASGIKRPKMYDLGYHNNNCVGCVKGGKGYWNRIRVDFPEVFRNRAKLERKIGATCIKDKHGRVYLDELNSDEGRHLPPIVAECGMFCEAIKL